MTRSEIMEKVTDIFHEVFDDDSIVLTDATTADDIEDWDSLTHITLITEIEDAFDFKFDMGDVLGMANVGEMITLLEKNV